MTPRHLTIAAFTFCTLIACAYAVVRRDDVSDSQYRKLGNRAAFASVGRVEMDYGDGYQAIGTATLYGTDRVLSAGHVFDGEALSGAIGVRINFGRGRVAYIDFKTPGVININPGYNSQTLANDISVVFLPSNFPINPAQLYTGRKVRKNTTVTFVGYGDTGTGRTGSNVFSIQKRGGQNTLGSYFLGGRAFEVDFDRPGFPGYSSFGSKVPLHLEGLIGPGDSGGSVWIKRGGRWQLIGINDYGLDWYPNGRGNGIEDDYGDHSGFVYVPKYLSWIASLTPPSS
ncbi:MAG TPA: trypsin-like serine protease [Chthoniobacterales bacterium]|nr:trypsin-like serine protease [Chthoniobacterales bacterium]